MKLDPGLSKLFDPAPAPFPPPAAEVGNPGTIRADDPPPPPEVSDEEAARMVPIPRLAGDTFRGAAVAEGMEVSRDGDEMRLLLLLLLGGLGTPGLLIPAAAAAAGAGVAAVSGFGVGGGAIGCGDGEDNGHGQQYECSRTRVT